MPRGRPRKPRLLRMDAAVDAMSQYGFSEEKVRKHVKELLKEYGGDQGWPFIEDCSYKELIDAILREAEKDDQEQVVQDGDQIKDKSRGDEEPPGTSSRASDAHQSPKDNAITNIVAVAEPTCPESAHSISVINNDGNSWKDILPDQASGCIEETANLVSENDKDPPVEVHSPRISGIPALPSPDSIPSLPPTKIRRHLPCYGWIESDEDDDNDFMLLQPASGVFGAKTTLPRELSKCMSGVRIKRKSRWDERPDDP